MNTPPSKPRLRFPNSLTPGELPLAKQLTFGLTDPAFREVVGGILTDWAHLEEEMIVVLGVLIGDRSGLSARPIFRSVQSTSARIAIMRALLERSPANTEKPTVYDEIIDEFATLTTERNNYAHGLWFTGDDGSVVRADPNDTGKVLPFMGAKVVTLAMARHIHQRIGQLNARIVHEIRLLPGT